MSQSTDILNHLLEGNRITPLEALHRFGCLRLGARIYDLERKYKNLKIKHDMVTREGKTYAEYYLEEFPMFLEERTQTRLRQDFGGQGNE